jgi:hypothetical protein
MSRWAEGEAHFEAALDRNARIGARPWLAHSQRQYAAMLLSRGQGDDREKAADLPARDEPYDAKPRSHTLTPRCPRRRRPAAPQQRVPRWRAGRRRASRRRTLASK